MTKRMRYRDWKWLWWYHFFLLLITVNGQTRYSIPEELKRGSVSYTLSKSECFTLKMKELSGDRYVPELVLEKPLDREKQSVHQLLLTALDGGSPVKTGTSSIIVTVLDNNDNVPVFKRTLYNISVPENSASGSVLVRVEATDADEGVNAELEYRFADSTPQALLSILRMNSDTGEIILLNPLDYESSNKIEISVTAKDRGVPEMEGHCRVQIIVIDVNDNVPEIILTSKPSPVREDAPKGAVVALISARDLDSGNNGKVMLQLTNESPFTLKPSFSNNYALITNGALDRETNSEYNVEITATDSGSPSLSSKKTICISIIDVNDNPPFFNQLSYNVYLKENGVAGSILYSVSAKTLIGQWVLSAEFLNCFRVQISAP
uniref:Cadherin domain-containing protein n=1 Tax=Cyprinodon variegatus TaxID=28743 RepID=A0A3Q2FUL3_CYPVA